METQRSSEPGTVRRFSAIVAPCFVPLLARPAVPLPAERRGDMLVEFKAVFVGVVFAVSGESKKKGKNPG